MTYSASDKPTRGAGQRIANNLSWLTGQETISRCIGFFISIYMARVLSQSDYGSIGICLTLMAILSSLVQIGSGTRAARLTATDPSLIADQHAEVTGLRILMTLFLMLSVALLHEPLGEALSIPPDLLLLGTALLLKPCFTVAWAFRGLDRMAPLALSGILERLLVLVGLLTLVRGGVSDTYLVIGLEVCGAIAGLIWLRVMLRRQQGKRLPIRFDLVNWGPMLRESLPISLASLIGSIYRYGDILLLGLLANSATAAIYLVAQKVVLTAALLPILVAKAAFPSTSRMVHSDPGATAQLQSVLVRLTLVATLPITAAMILLAEPIILQLFGQNYKAAVVVFQVLSLTLPLFALGTFQETFLMALPRPRALLNCRIISSAVHVVLVALLIPDFGATGAAIGCLAGQLAFTIATAIAWYRTGRPLPLSLRLLAPLGASAIAAVTFLLIPDAGPWLKAFIAAIVYIMAVFLFRGVDLEELKVGLSHLHQSTSRA
ncbi:MAG: oligosaccharide flippase family protein [Pseudomonadota bacterium]